MLETLPLDLAALLPQIQARLEEQQTYHLRRLINATGVIVHTNLGRSLLAPAAVANLQEIVRTNRSPPIWRAGDLEIGYFAGRLIIRQTHENHEQTTGLLAALRAKQRDSR